MKNKYVECGYNVIISKLTIITEILHNFKLHELKINFRNVQKQVC